MNDEFLSRLREEPRPEFAAALRERLRAIEREAAGEPRRPRPWLRWPTLATAAAALVAVGALAVSPELRAAARGFLELFRIKHFVAVPFDPERVARLRDGQLDVKTLLGDQVEVLEDPGAPTLAADAQAAGELAGFAVKVPSAVPQGYAAPEVKVRGHALARVTVDAARVDALLESLGVKATLPPGLDGASVTIDTPPAVLLRYRREGGEITFAQARSPEVALPPGVELSKLGEIALQVTGLSPEEARSFARTVDWRTTLLVAVPAEQAAYREVDVRGAQGLLVTALRRDEGHADGARRRSRRSVLLWSEGDMVYALAGGGNGIDLIEMARSLS